MEKKGLYLVLLIGVLFLTACGPQAQQFGEFSSQDASAVTTSAGVIEQDSKVISLCSRDIGAVSDVRARVMAVANGSAVNPNVVRLKIDALPELSTDATTAVEIYKGFVTSSGSVQYAMNPNNPSFKQDLSLSFEKRSGGSFSSLQGSFTDLTWNNIKNFVVEPNALNHETSNDFFKDVSLVVNLGPNGDTYHFVQLVFYTNNNQVSRTVTVLLPPFEANYEKYAATHQTTLNNLHPLKSLSGLGYSDAQYGAAASNLCF